MWYVVVRENRDAIDPENRDIPINVYAKEADAAWMCRHNVGKITYRVVPVVPLESPLATGNFSVDTITADLSKLQSDATI